MKFLYLLFCKIYCFISTQIENIFFKKLNVNNKLKKDGYYVVRNELNYFLMFVNLKKLKQINI